jgi:putative DNA primase/helicase
VQDIAAIAQAIVDGSPVPAGRIADESFFSAQWVSYAFDMTAECPKFRAYMDQALDNPEQILVLSFIGLALTSITKFEVFIYLYGRAGREGKSTLIDIMRALMCWPGSVSYVDVSQLKERFASAPLAESSINITGDAADVQYGDLRRVEGAFKDMVSGGNFECELKNQNKRVAKCRSRFILAGNSLPEFCDRSDAIWERLRICSFPRSCPVEKRDPDLSRKIITSELPGVLALAINGLADVFARNRMTDTDTGLALKKELRRIGDHEANFIEDSGYIKTGKSADYIKTEEVYAEYRTWSESNGYRPLGMNRMCSRIRDILHIQQTRIPADSGKRISVFSGVSKGMVLI